MTESTSTSLHTTRRLSGRARAGIGGGIGLAAAIAATLVISGTAGASAANEPHTPSSMVVEGSGASDQTGSGPSSMVVEGSGASDAVGPVEGAVPTDLDTVAPGYGADALVEKDVVTDGAVGSAAGPASMVIEGSNESDAVGHTDPATGVTVLEGDMLIAPDTREHPIDEPLSGPSSMVIEGSGASDETGTAPASMVIEGSNESDAVGYTDPTTGVTVLEGDMLIVPRTASL